MAGTASESTIPKLANEHFLQSYNDYWKHGSIRKDLSKLSSVPVLAIGGWADGYTNTPFRLATVKDRQIAKCRALIGPWSHEWPDTAIPGPNV